MSRREMTYYDDRDGRRGRRGRRGLRGLRGRRGMRSLWRSGSESYGGGVGGFGGGGIGSNRERRRLSAVDWLMMIVSVVVAAGVAISWMARWISPVQYGFLSAAGLFMPVLYVANFLCLLYWVIRWRRGVWIPLVVFVAGMGGLTLFFRPQLTRQHGAVSDRSLVKVITYNVRGMLREGPGGRLVPSTTEVIGVVDSLRPDILCIQEFASTEDNPAAERFVEALPVYHYRRVRLRDGGEQGQYGAGNAIFSKYPIVGTGHIDFANTNNSILWADVAIGRDTVRLFNAHLQTTAIKASDEQYLVDLDFVGDEGRALRGIVGRLTRNYVIRAAQADTLAARIAASPHPVIVCGDFNDTPASWAYRRIAAGLDDSFREAGIGYGHTYRGFFNLLRIDYMLHSRGMECVEYSSPEFDVSDHNPVSVRLRIR